MSKLSSVFDLVSVLSSHPGELELFRKDPKKVVERYGLAGKIRDEDIREIMASTSLEKHGSFLAKSITVIECPNAGT
ncbi:hypothetical protein INT08_06565 [Prosthecochloris sp. N3]|uniref:Extradiol ring-cleavage dioxygenase LigAB LigA subunit domain-containing protein n=1 Tax=Prosthecochloris ethylica TaxID=2743976 RepID=A0ABR9XST1_9CHLB|nr:hypothetical protein [Prosthecochloris ethylica]MBF0585300.1 hypothetical protein [Prosthecochloris ethylica]MBF0636836.1 hypothetical protein [Prosthecochloris ethylica]NUK46529.1 hypothetical protein [Prosthecochloris ethylica]